MKTEKTWILAKKDERNYEIDKLKKTQPGDSRM